MAKGKNRYQKPYKTKAVSTKPSSLDVKCRKQQTKIGHESTKAEESPSARRSLLAHLGSRTPLQKVSLIVLLCSVSLMCIHRLLSDSQLEMQNWVMDIQGLLSEHQLEMHIVVPHRMLLLLMVLQYSDILPKIQIGLKVMFLVYISVQPLLVKLSTKIVRMAVRSRRVPVQPAEKTSAVQETEHVEKFKPSGSEKSKQKQNSRKQEMRTNTKTIKKSVIGNESSQENQGKESETVTCTSQSVIGNEPSQEKQVKESENVTCTSKAEQPYVSSLGKKTADSNEQEQADLNEVIGNEMATKSIGESRSTNNKIKSKRSGRKGKDLRRANESKAVDISGFDAKQISLPTGMQNLGNTCYFNAVMQNLNQSFLLRELLSEQTSDLPLTKSMIEFYEQMSRKSNKSFNPSSLFQSLCSRSPRFKGGNQQDSHELLRHILDGLRNEEREASPEPEKRKILTKVDKVFGGHFLTVYTCNRCNRPYHICEPFLDISLPVEPQEYVDDVDSESYEEDYEEDITQRQTADHELSYQSAAKTLMTPLNTQDNQDTQRSRSSTKGSGSSLSGSKRKSNDHDPKTSRPRKRSRSESRSVLDFLDVFTRMECIAKEYLCMACHEERVSRGETDYEMTSATKRTLVFNPPALLTLHLKRFKQTANGFVKCNDMITFPDMFDLSPYCSSICMICLLYCENSLSAASSGSVISR